MCSWLSIIALKGCEGWQQKNFPLLRLPSRDCNKSQDYCVGVSRCGFNIYAGQHYSSNKGVNQALDDFWWLAQDPLVVFKKLFVPLPPIAVWGHEASHVGAGCWLNLVPLWQSCSRLQAWCACCVSSWLAAVGSRQSGVSYKSSRYYYKLWFGIFRQFTSVGCHCADSWCQGGGSA